MRVTFDGRISLSLRGNTLNGIYRRIVRIGSLFALISACTVVRATAAEQTLVAQYQGREIRFTHVERGDAGLAIGVEDPGLAALLQTTGAMLTWQPGERYVLITTAEPVVVSFSVGDRRYDIGPISLEGPFAPYQHGDEVYVPLNAVLRGLDLVLRQAGPVAVLQPQLASLDVKASAYGATVVAHGGAALDPRIVHQSASAIVFAFEGVGTSLARMHAVDAGGVKSIGVEQTGTVRDPETLVTVTLQPGATLRPPRSDDDRDVVLAFDSGDSVAPSPAPAFPPPSSIVPAPLKQSAPTATAAASSPPTGPTQVTGLVVQPTTDGYTIAIEISGNATFQWHRLRPPDNRFWVDISGAQLQGTAVDEPEPAPLGALRVRQMDPQTVRVALSLQGPEETMISPTVNGLTITVAVTDSPAGLAQTGSGSVGTVLSSTEQAAPVTPAPAGEYAGGLSSAETGWKFGPHGSSYVPTVTRLIVIDPGHGGPDTGAIHNGTTEAELNLAISFRLAKILRSRGWKVTLTRTTDSDVLATRTSTTESEDLGYHSRDAFDLQARDDIANMAGPRLLVSVHCNSFINSGPNGVTVYYAKPVDLPLAEVMSHVLGNNLGLKDDGIVKSHLYVPLHANAPTVLIETAFLSNPYDYAKLTSESWQELLATDIADAIEEYADKYPVSSQ
jgi:N-acetylmuramoyl-L-alanine amidase